MAQSSYDVISHRLQGIRQVDGFCDDRPSTEVDLLVIHGISLPAGHFGGDYIERLFSGSLDCGCHPDLGDLERVEVSSHLLIRRDGSIIQFVPFDRRAWHAGESSFQGRERCNDFSIGIELEGTDHSRYRDEQYEVLVGVSRQLIEVYGIPPQHVVGHCDIAPGRKTDPGASFDWNRLREGLER